jgi:hypothetical protein
MMKTTILLLLFVFCCFPLANAEEAAVKEYDPIVISGWGEEEFALRGEPETQLEMAMAHIRNYIGENPDLKLVLLVEGCASHTGPEKVNDQFGNIRAEQVRNMLKFTFPEAMVKPVSRGESRNEIKVIITPKFVRDEALAMAENIGSLNETAKTLANTTKDLSNRIGTLERGGLPWYWWLILILILLIAAVIAFLTFMNGRKISGVSDEVSRQGQVLTLIEQRTDEVMTTPFEIEGQKYRYRPAVDVETGLLVSPYKGTKYGTIHEVRRSAIPVLKRDACIRQKEIDEGRLVKI